MGDPAEPVEPAEPAPRAVDRFELLAGVVTSGILAADADGRVDYVNPAAVELFWCEGRQLHGDGWLASLHAEDRAEMAAAAARAVRTGTHSTATGRIDVMGLDRWVRARFHVLPDDDGSVGWVATFDDVTTERERAAELTRQATHDVLTGLPNRALLHDRLATALTRMRRGGGTVGLLFLDLDRFKAVNDELGHAAGDRVLTEVADRIRATVRASDTAARFGGDEFVLVTEGAALAEIRMLAERVASAVRRPIDLGTEVREFTVCVGGTATTDPEVDSRTLLELADEAMYRAKRVGGGIEIVDSATPA